MNNPAWKMYVFREGRYEITGAELVTRLREALCRARYTSGAECEDALLGALIAAGELECAVLDACPGASLKDPVAGAASEITDRLACAFLTGNTDSLSSILRCAERLCVEGQYRAAVHEGFAYYALHPRKLAILLDSMLSNHDLPHDRQCGVRVLGIRSIGLTLSAVVCAALTLRGIPASRTTVRPTGHPYDRKLQPTAQLRQWLTGAEDAEFLIVDEGPGISGSSFLAVAEALEACSIPPSRIHMIGSRQVDQPATLLARDAAQRWPRYRSYTVPATPLAPEEAGEIVSPTSWQKYFYPGDNTESGSWRALEPAMFLSRDRHSLFCFAGFGHYGEAVCARARHLSETGFAPRYLGSVRGFRQAAIAAGKTLTAADRSRELLARIAAYLALRSEDFAVATGQSCELEAMLRWNWQIEFGAELGSQEARLQVAAVTVCDNLLAPAQWLRTGTGKLLKLDAGNYGDNHFFPGPCDIAWDVAGCIVEWELEGEALEYFLAEYTRHSGDSVAERLGPYLLAYTTFHMAHARMAAAAMHGEADEILLQRDYLRYRAKALRLSPASAPESPTPIEGLIAPGLRAG